MVYENIIMYILYNFQGYQFEYLTLKYCFIFGMYNNLLHVCCGLYNNKDMHEMHLQCTANDAKVPSVYIHVFFNIQKCLTSFLSSEIIHNVYLLYNYGSG